MPPIIIQLLLHQKKSGHRRCGTRIFGGDEEDRTLDLTDANRTLSQLSYAPKSVSVRCHTESKDSLYHFISFVKGYSRFFS